mgnify:CR=1 FL=1
MRIEALRHRAREDHPLARDRERVVLHPSEVRATEAGVAYVAECRLLNPDPAAAWVGTWEE